MASAAVTDVLSKLETEREWYEALPSLLEAHGRELVVTSAEEFLSRGQVKECLKRYDARRERLAWIHATTSDGGRLQTLALILTDRSLNECARDEWDIGDVSAACQAAADMLGLLSEHCAAGTPIAAGVGLAPQLAAMSREMPAVHRFLAASSTLDLGSDGVQTFSTLCGQPMLGTADVRVRSGPKSASHFEADLCAGVSPALRAPIPPDALAITRCEYHILALGWAREHFLEPPRAAKYVTAGLFALAAMCVSAIARLGISMALGT